MTFSGSELFNFFFFFALSDTTRVSDWLSATVVELWNYKGTKERMEMGNAEHMDGEELKSTPCLRLNLISSSLWFLSGASLQKNDTGTTMKIKETLEVFYSVNPPRVAGRSICLGPELNLLDIHSHFSFTSASFHRFPTIMPPVAIKIVFVISLRGI